MTLFPRLSVEQLRSAQRKADRFVEALKTTAQRQNNGFPELFATAAHLIQTDVDAFCNRAGDVLDEIDAYGQEPQLDDDWLQALTGDKDTFYFSTDSLLTTPLTLPRKPRHPQQTPDKATVVNQVEQAIDQAEQTVLAIAHTENTQHWIQTVRRALTNAHSRVSFEQLLATTQLQPSELWLGLLLGHEHWCLHQDQVYGKLCVELRT